MYIQGEKVRGDLIGAEGEQQNVEKLRREMKRRNITALITKIGDFTAEEPLELELNHFRRTFKKTKMDDRAAEEFGKANIIGKFRNIKPENAKLIGEESQNDRKIDVYLVRHVDLMGIKAELSGEEGTENDHLGRPGEQPACQNSARGLLPRRRKEQGLARILRVCLERTIRSRPVQPPGPRRLHRRRTVGC